MNPNESIYGYTPGGGGGVPKKKGQGVTPPCLGQQLQGSDLNFHAYSQNNQTPCGVYIRYHYVQ